MRELPTMVLLAVGLFEDAAVFLPDGSSLGFRSGGDSAVFVAEEGLKHLLIDWKGWTRPLEDVHVIIGHDHTMSNLFIGAGMRQGFVVAHLKAVTLWQAVTRLAEKSGRKKRNRITQGKGLRVDKAWWDQ